MTTKSTTLCRLDLLYGLLDLVLLLRVVSDLAVVNKSLQHSIELFGAKARCIRISLEIALVKRPTAFQLPQNRRFDLRVISLGSLWLVHLPHRLLILQERKGRSNNLGIYLIFSARDRKHCQESHANCVQARGIFVCADFVFNRGP